MGGRFWPAVRPVASSSLIAMLEGLAVPGAVGDRPCNQSDMNYWMSGTRVGIGLVAGAILVPRLPGYGMRAPVGTGRNR
jgi:hypothetical protein